MDKLANYLTFHVNYNCLAFRQIPCFKISPRNSFVSVTLTYVIIWSKIIFNMSTEIELVPFFHILHIVDKPSPEQWMVLFFVFIQLLLEDQRLHVFGGLDLDQWDLTCSTSNAVLVTAAFKSLLSIQTFIPYTFYLPKSVVSAEHYGGGLFVGSVDVGLASSRRAWNYIFIQKGCIRHTKKL